VPPADITVTPGARAVQQGERLGIDVPNFVASDSRAVQALGQASRQLPSGGRDHREGRRQAHDGARQQGRADCGRADGNAGLDKAALGDHLRGVMERAVENIDETNHSAYRGFRDLIDPTKPVKEALAPLQDALSQIMPERMAAGETGVGKLKPVANLLQRPDGVTFDGLQRARSQISKAIRFDSREGRFRGRRPEAHVRRPDRRNGSGDAISRS
jgi:hypothetical protein